MKSLFYLLLCATFFLTACNSQRSHDTTAAVQTDNGKPWLANPETTTGIDKMQTLIMEIRGETLTAERRTKLSKDLDLEFQNIFKQCTMTGEAHNQLHNFLLPMKQLIANIASENAGLAEQSIEDLKQHLDTYKTYFQ